MARNQVSMARTFELVLWVGAGAILIYLLKQVRGGIEAAQAAYSGAVNRTANMIETFFPLVDPDSMMTYAVTFPDGSRHAVPGETVSRGGFFVYHGAQYRLMASPSGAKIAVAA